MTRRRPYTQRDITRWDLAPEDARNESWKLDAACRGMGPDLFFPERGETGHYSYADEARGYPAMQVCRGCPVRTECGEYGAKERFGIWGGLSGRQRKQARTRRAG